MQIDNILCKQNSFEEINQDSLQEVFSQISLFSSNDSKLDLKTVYFFIERIKSLIILPEDWSGPETFAPQEECVRSALLVLRYIISKGFKTFELLSIYPSPNGTIIFRLEKQDKIFSLEIGNKGFNYFTMQAT